MKIDYQYILSELGLTSETDLERIAWGTGFTQEERAEISTLLRAKATDEDLDALSSLAFDLILNSDSTHGLFSCESY